MNTKAGNVGDLIKYLLTFDPESEIYTSGDYDGDGHLYVLDAGEWVEIEVVD